MVFVTPFIAGENMTEHSSLLTSLKSIFPESSWAWV